MNSRCVLRELKEALLAKQGDYVSIGIESEQLKLNDVVQGFDISIDKELCIESNNLHINIPLTNEFKISRCNEEYILEVNDINIYVCLL